MAANDSSTPTLAQICGRLGVDDPEGLLHEVQHTLSNVYRMNGDRYDESVGDDMGSFGFNVYKTSWHQLEKVLPGFDSALSTLRPNNSLTVFTPGPQMKVYRGGANENFDIESYDLESGSMTKRRIPARNTKQLSLFEQESESNGDEEVGVLDVDGWVIVHSGNPDEGLLGIWIGAPRIPSDEDPSTWAFIFHLPDLCAARNCGGGSIGGVHVEPSPVVPSGPGHHQQPVPEIVVERRNKNDQESVPDVIVELRRDVESEGADGN